MNQSSFELSGNAPEYFQLTLDRTKAKPGKVCGSCHVYKPFSKFGKSPVSKDRYAWMCYDCYKIYRDKSGTNTRYAKTSRERYNTDMEYKEQTLVRVRNTIAKKLGVPGTFTIEEWQEIKAQYDNRCAYCGWKAPLLTIDHFWPMAWYKLGFSKAVNEASNLVPACIMCNLAKRHYNPFYFLAWKNGLLQEL